MEIKELDNLSFSNTKNNDETKNTRIRDIFGFESKETNNLNPVYNENVYFNNDITKNKTAKEDLSNLINNVLHNENANNKNKDQNIKFNVSINNNYYNPKYNYFTTSEEQHNNKNQKDSNSLQNFFSI